MSDFGSLRKIRNRTERERKREREREGEKKGDHCFSQLWTLFHVSGKSCVLHFYQE